MQPDVVRLRMARALTRLEFVRGRYPQCSGKAPAKGSSRVKFRAAHTDSCLTAVALYGE